jgi:hypothetical protein
MSKPVKKPKKLNDKMQAWAKLGSGTGLSHAGVQMARELGMNSKRLGKLDNHKQEPWKMPLRQFIQDLYFKRFGSERPVIVYTIEEQVQKSYRNTAGGLAKIRQKLCQILAKCRMQLEATYGK